MSHPFGVEYAGHIVVFKEFESKVLEELFFGKIYLMNLPFSKLIVDPQMNILTSVHEHLESLAEYELFHEF